MSTRSHSGPQPASSRRGASSTTAGLPCGGELVAFWFEPAADARVEQVFEELAVGGAGFACGEDALGDGGAVDAAVGG